MPGKRMLRDMMSVNDIYNFAETIIEMLREEYGSYDADTLDEVQVEERFAQRLQARGYEVRSPSQAAPAPTPTPTPAPTPAPIGLSQDTPIVPVTVVRTRRATPSSTGGTTGAARTRRTTTPSDGTRPSAGSDTGRASSESARPTPESSAESGGESSASGSETSSRPVRQRRTTRPRTSSNGETGS